jgi:hypothetical protein
MNGVFQQESLLFSLYINEQFLHYILRSICRIILNGLENIISMSEIFSEKKPGNGYNTSHSHTESKEWLSDIDPEREKAVEDQPEIPEINVRDHGDEEIVIRATKSYDEPPDGGREAWMQACCAHLVSSNPLSG